MASLVCLQQGNVKKSIKFIKIVNIEEENLQIFSNGTPQKMKFSIKDFFNKWSHLLNKLLMQNFSFCEVRLE